MTINKAAGMAEEKNLREWRSFTPEHLRLLPRAGHSVKMRLCNRVPVVPASEKFWEESVSGRVFISFNFFLFSIQGLG